MAAWTSRRWWAAWTPAGVWFGSVTLCAGRECAPVCGSCCCISEPVGFSGAPRYLGTDEQDRHVVSWVDGDVPVPPYPDWAMTDAALVSLGRLIRDYHDAVASFSPVASDWSAEWADPGGGPVVCHNDLFPENVVFRDGIVVALIDFDMAGPGRPLWDLAIAAEEWAPLHAPGSRLSTADSLDAVHRVGLLAGAYGLAADRAEELLDIVVEEKAHSTANVLAQAAAGDPVWGGHIDADRLRGAHGGRRGVVRRTAPRVAGVHSSPHLSRMTGLPHLDRRLHRGPDLGMAASYAVRVRHGIWARGACQGSTPGSSVVEPVYGHLMHDPESSTSRAAR